MSDILAAIAVIQLQETHDRNIEIENATTVIASTPGLHLPHGGRVGLDIEIVIVKFIGLLRMTVAKEATAVAAAEAVVGPEVAASDAVAAPILVQKAVRSCWKAFRWT